MAHVDVRRVRERRQRIEREIRRTRREYHGGKGRNDIDLVHYIAGLGLAGESRSAHRHRSALARFR